MNSRTSLSAGVLAALSLACASAAMAQTTSPVVTAPVRGGTESSAKEAPADAAAKSATTTSRQTQTTTIDQAAQQPASNVTITAKPLAITGGAAGSATGARVLRIPAACTPKTNSLDCVQDSTQAGQGANVEGRVRNGVIGEVGTGKATTEGRGGAKRDEACTPSAGQLSCTPPAKP